MPAPTPTRRRLLSCLTAITAIVALTGCDPILTERYGYTITNPAADNAPRAGTRCTRNNLGTGTVDPAGQVLRCTRTRTTRTWKPQPDRSPTRPVVLLYGDSIAEETQFALTTQLGGDWTVVTRVFGGTAPCDYSTGAARDIRTYHPTVVITSFTGNNITPCTRPGGTPLDGDDLAANYQTHLGIIATAATDAGARVVLATSPITADPTKAGRANRIATATLELAHTLATTPDGPYPTGRPVYGIDTGAVFTKSGTDPTARIGAQWLPCQPDGSEAASCVQNPVDNDGTTLDGGWVQVHTPMPDGLHLCPVWNPSLGFRLCPVRNIGAERYATALRNAILTATTTTTTTTTA